MIFEILNRISALLNDKLKIQFKLTKDIVKIQAVDNQNSEGSITVSMIGMERDTSSGISFGRRKISASHTAKSLPTWDMNLYVLIAAVFPKKQYADSLKILTATLKVLQENNVLTFDEYGALYTLEPVNISFQELSNLWSISGGSYYPSLVCKVRTITIDSDTMIQIDRDVEQRNIRI